MRSYRFLFLGPQLDCERDEPRQAQDDLQALDLAHAECATHVIEIWDEGRKVARVARGAALDSSQAAE